MAGVKRPLQQEPNGKFAAGNNLGAGAGGKRHTRFITQHLISLLNETVQMPGAKTDADKKKFAVRVHWLCEKMITMAMDGDATCMRMIMDRVEGTPVQTVNFRDTRDDAEVPSAYTREHLSALKPDELSKVYAQSLLADAGLGDQSIN